MGAQTTLESPPDMHPDMKAMNHSFLKLRCKGGCEDGEMVELLDAASFRV
eukprot:CAMPEP_0118661270 /NCGR_PEP_ID=MMETSP0785-20121206/16183_1 /TAXON_ID=91992 /ORGANISM="Bolidomonas pacifica, Strain CCMP 1866" /LENGTH=49 /DNA_ID= /DNA_START= /DNA_END= /DNA_ORIENTATION=